MKINVAEILPEGLDIKIQYGIDFLDNFYGKSEKERTVKIKEGFLSKIHLEKAGEVVKVEGMARVKLELRCVRCNEWFTVIFELKIHDEFHSTEEMKGKGQIELKERDMDYSFYTPPYLDVDEILAENLFLSIPDYPLCNNNCKGLCHYCGTNLNKNKCNCSVNQPVEGWKKVLATISGKEENK